MNCNSEIHEVTVAVFSVDGGPLTDNVVLSSDQRDLYFQRTAGLIELVNPYFRFPTKS